MTKAAPMSVKRGSEGSRLLVQVCSAGIPAHGPSCRYRACAAPGLLTTPARAQRSADCTRPRREISEGGPNPKPFRLHALARTPCDC